MGNSCIELLKGRTIYHATPLHYLPAILECGELRSQRLVGYEFARPTARTRDRKLALDTFVHCSLAPQTPLLLDKLAKGFPHVVLQFDPNRLVDERIAILPCSTKAWRSSWQCRPINEYLDMLHIIRQFDECGRFQGLEILVFDRLPLNAMIGIQTVTFDEWSLVDRLIGSFEQFHSIPISFLPASTSPNYRASGIDTIRDYFEICCRLGRVLPPPKLQFD